MLYRSKMRTFAFFPPESIDWYLPNFQQMYSISGLYNSIFKLRRLAQPICGACWRKLTRPVFILSAIRQLLGGLQNGLETFTPDEPSTLCKNVIYVGPITSDIFL